LHLTSSVVAPMTGYFKSDAKRVASVSYLKVNIMLCRLFSIGKTIFSRTGVK